MSDKMTCPVCNKREAEFTATVAAPGRGLHWDCSACGAALIQFRQGGSLLPIRDVDPECLTLNESDVI
jgi:transcription elongation factor Elf1